MTRDELEAVIAQTAFASLVGARLDSFAPGSVSLSVPLWPELTMHLGNAHGAVLGFLADSACAWAAASVAGQVVTAEYKLNLLAPGVGELLHAQGDVLKSSGRVVTCRADVFAFASGRRSLIATALATLMKVP
ncbi:PaaI family thioesterase [Variovorax paradoxus]|nr:PaaI family thioesterase [Variovorax paradoxus]